MSTGYHNNFIDTTSFSDQGALFTLTNGNVKSFVVPGDASFKFQAKFKTASNSNLFAGLNVSPVIPTSDSISTSDAYLVEYKPEKMLVKGGDVIYLVTPDTILYGGVSLRVVQQGY